MRILSLNTWGGALFEELAARLPTCGADVLCLQEVTRTAGADGWTTFADAARELPQRADLLADLTALLPDHHGHLAVADSGPVTTADGRRHRQDFGLATFVHRRLPVIGTAVAPIHGTPAAHTDWPTDGRPRVALGVRVVDPTTGTTVAVVNVHGLRDGAGKHDTPARLAQAERIAEIVTTLREDGDLVVVCGDLNVLPGSGTFEVLSRIGLVDLVGDADTRTSHYAKPVRHADYVLVSEPDRVSRFEVVADPEVSDHRALVLDLGHPPSPGPSTLPG